MVQEDIDAGYVYDIPGGMQEAHNQWQSMVAIGKLNLAIGEGRPARLVMDSTVPNVNPKVQIRERVENPSLMSLKASLQGYDGVSDLSQ